MKRKALLPLLFLSAYSLFGQLASFDDLFPGIDPEQREKVFSGVLTESRDRGGDLRLLPSGEIGTIIAGLALGDLRPACIVESLTVVPYLGAPLNRLDIYNAMGNIRDLQGRLYHSFTRDDYVALFQEATRIESPKRTRAIPDPAAAAALPREDRVYICLKDINFGNSYYQADIAAEGRGLLYGLSNFRNLSYGIIPIIREKKFNAQFYVEPIAEGVLVYAAAAAEVSSFVAGQVDIPSAIKKRGEVILGWMIDNIAARETQLDMDASF